MSALLLLVAATSAQNAPGTNKARHLDIPAISREASGAVVSIVMSDKDGHPIAQGSGFFISKDGHVLTNYHVIKTGSSAVVKLPDGAFFAVDGVLASDKNRDVAVIKAHGNNFRTLTLGDSDRLQVGEEVVAIGNPLSLESTVSNGIVSAIRTVENEGGRFVQITAPISPGSSGGPLFNMAGEVVGITTSRIEGGENLNFAIPINDFKRLQPPKLLVGYTVVPHALPDEAETETAAPEQSTGPSLADTLEWMVSSSANGVEHHEEYSFNVGTSTVGYLQVASFRFVTHDSRPREGDPSGTMSACHAFTIVTTIISREIRGKGTGDSASRFFQKFDLGDVDPDSINESGADIKFRITNDQHRIPDVEQHAVDVDHLDSGQLVSTEALPDTAQTVLHADDTSYGSRLAKAFKHAVILCGGKPSTF
ncbi:MAG: trypsin-like peptidase domain-containing protein [Candidatus Sulfotelmatobacter sp.]|jgi:hypothetical protein